ncbi:hypothetical protein RRSWK_06072 [Rhodopirellula sp. SWK7]|nr:hypothetical protein RRSWK_06072 [Rhodopirellula sp. SWK7]
MSEKKSFGLVCAAAAMRASREVLCCCIDTAEHVLDSTVHDNHSEWNVERMHHSCKQQRTS